MTRTTIGIIGGGQLAALLVKVAKDEGADCVVLDEDKDCPAALAGARMITGDRHDPGLINRLADECDVVTVDVENVNVPCLAELARSGKRVIPHPATLTILTNKCLQKQALVDAGIPTSPFTLFDGAVDKLPADRPFPCVQKAAVGGYDGRGVQVLRGPEDSVKLMPVPGFIEDFVDCEAELSVMVARSDEGITVAYEPVEMSFNDEGNLLDMLYAPARIDAKAAESAKLLATRAVEALDGVGVYGVEMFLTRAGDLLINELAPRTHNSGHYTIDACATSQFQQQYRILTFKAPGPVRQLTPAVMFNLLGEKGFEGETVVEGQDRVASLAGVSIYLYGKSRCFPLRKMGHVTVTAASLDEALRIAGDARRIIRVRGECRIED